MEGVERKAAVAPVWVRGLKLSIPEVRVPVRGRTRMGAWIETFVQSIKNYT